MADFLAFIKWISIMSLCLLGVGFLYINAGGSIPFVKWGTVEAHSLPVGVVLIAAGVALAYFWRISVTTSSSGGGGGFISKHAVFDKRKDL
ncbi:MAG: hypothetical protein KGL29_01030 [Alphaproteobacteria bacterium]|nr:hypothetical protein [Alphaproteobacteria bacterium]